MREGVCASSLFFFAPNVAVPPTFAEPQNPSKNRKNEKKLTAPQGAARMGFWGYLWPRDSRTKTFLPRT